MIRVKIFSPEMTEYKKQKYSGWWLLTDTEEGASVFHYAEEKNLLQKHQWMAARNIFQAIYLGEFNSIRVVRGLAVHFANVYTSSC